MADLGYGGQELFKRGRFRPATFWKTDRCELVAPSVHKDRTLLTVFRRRPCAENQQQQIQQVQQIRQQRNWYVLNCHLQAGQQAPRRVRQIHEGCRAVLTLARKLKEPNPEQNLALIVCGDFNGGAECGAVRYLEDGGIDGTTFREDGQPVVQTHKMFPLATPLTDAVATVTQREPPPTLVVAELISSLVQNGADQAFSNPELSNNVVERLQRIYRRYATVETDPSLAVPIDEKVMGRADVERWLIAINGKVGRGSEFREAARHMGWKEHDGEMQGEEEDEKDEEVAGKKATITLPEHGTLSMGGFVDIYAAELRQGKFWGIAHDLAVLGEPLPDAGVFQSRYDRMYCSSAVQTTAVMDFLCSRPCPNDVEPSDHLPVAAAFVIKES